MKKVLKSYFQFFKQCCGSGSMWIRIVMAPLDPDPYWECGPGARSRAVKMTPKKDINKIFQIAKRKNHFDEGLIVFT